MFSLILHLQALLYALTQASKSRNEVRARNAKSVLVAMRDICPVLVDEASLVNNELVRCAILWHEQWNEALDDASRLYFQVFGKFSKKFLGEEYPRHAGFVEALASDDRRRGKDAQRAVI